MILFKTIYFRMMFREIFWDLFEAKKWECIPKEHWYKRTVYFLR